MASWQGIQRCRAKVQIGAELLCKGERGGDARGHAGKLTRGQGIQRYKLEARSLRGLVEKKIREYRVWSIEYRGEAGLNGGSRGRPDDWLGGIIRGHEDRRSRGPEELAPGFRRLKAERLTPERLTPVAVTRHLEYIMTAACFPVSGLPLSGRVDPGGR